MATSSSHNDTVNGDYDEHLPNPDFPKLYVSHPGEFRDDHDGNGGPSVKITRSTYLFCLCAAVNSCNLGYDIGVSTEASKLIQDDLGLTRMQREIFVGSINFFASTFAVL
jgi:hypothetical protein